MRGKCGLGGGGAAGWLLALRGQLGPESLWCSTPSVHPSVRPQLQNQSEHGAHG